MSVPGGGTKQVPKSVRLSTEPCIRERRWHTCTFACHPAGRRRPFATLLIAGRGWLQHTSSRSFRGLIWALPAQATFFCEREDKGAGWERPTSSWKTRRVFQPWLVGESRCSPPWRTGSFVPLNRGRDARPRSRFLSRLSVCMVMGRSPPWASVSGFSVVLCLFYLLGTLAPTPHPPSIVLRR